MHDGLKVNPDSWQILRSCMSNIRQSNRIAQDLDLLDTGNSGMYKVSAWDVSVFHFPEKICTCCVVMYVLQSLSFILITSSKAIKLMLLIVLHCITNNFVPQPVGLKDCCLCLCLSIFSVCSDDLNEFNSIRLSMYLGWVGLWGFLWWAPSAKRKDLHGVSSGWSSVWHRSNTGLSSTQYEQIPIILGVWPFWLTPFFGQ